MMSSLALSTIRHRKAGFAGAVVALFFAAALVGAAGQLLQTGLRGTVPPDRYSGTPLVVAGDQNAHVIKKKKKGKVKRKAKALAEHVWIPEQTLARVREVPGVGEAIPEVLFPAYVVVKGRTVPGPADTSSWGHSWESAAITPMRLREGRAPAAPGEVVVDTGLAARAGLRVGSRVTVQATGSPAEYQVVGTAAGGPDKDRLARQAALFFSSAEARRLAPHPGMLSAIGVRPAPGIPVSTLGERIGQALTGTPGKVYTGGERGPLEFLDAAKARVMLISLGGTLAATALLVAAIVVVGTFALAIQQRYRELALLRAVAATPRQIRALIGREAIVVGIAAGVPGGAFSLVVGAWLRDGLIDAGAVPANLEPSRSPLAILAAVVTTVVAAWIAARAAARRTARIRPAEALREAVVEPTRPGPVRFLAGLAALVAAIVLTGVLSGLSTEQAATPVTMLTSLLWVFTVALLGPLLVTAAVAVLSVPLRRLSRVSGFLAAANTRAGARRLASMVTPLTLAITMACTILFSQTTLGAAAGRQLREGTIAQYALTSAGPGIPHAAAEAVRAVPGVQAVTEVVDTSARGYGLAKYSVQGVTPERLDQVLDLRVTSGSLAGLGDDGAALSTNAARLSGTHVGDPLKLYLGDGTPVTLQVRAIYQRGLGFPDLTLSRDLVAAHVDNPLDRSVLVKAAPGSGDLRGALRRQARAYGQIQVFGRSGMHVRQATQQRVNQKIQYLVLGLIIAFTVIAVVNTLTMATADRTGEFALLRLIGTTRRQITRMVRWESLLISTIATVFATITALVTLTAFSSGMTGSPPSVPPLTYLEVIGAAAALTFASTGLTIRAALRYHPADAIGSRSPT